MFHKPFVRKSLAIVIALMTILSTGSLLTNRWLPRKIVEIDGYLFKINFGKSYESETFGFFSENAFAETEENFTGYHINFYAIDSEEAVVHLREKLITQQNSEVSPKLFNFINEHSHNKNFTAPKGKHKDVKSDNCEHSKIKLLSLKITTHNPYDSETPCPNGLEYNGRWCDNCDAWIDLIYRGYADFSICSGKTQPFCKVDFENMTW